MSFTMESPSLSGRRVTEDDLPFVLGVWNDERVAATVGGRTSESELTDRLRAWSQHWDLHRFGTSVFSERSSGRLVGWGGLQHSTIGVGERLTVGYVVAPDAWGRGYATEIASASVAYAVNALAASLVTASVRSTNAASRRVLEKVGFCVEVEIQHAELLEVVYSIVP